MRSPLLLSALLVILAVACDGSGAPGTPTLPPGGTPAPSALPTQAPAPSLPTPQPTPETLPPAPSGSLLYLVSGWDFEMYRVNSDGSGLMNLTNNPNADAPGTWSPDGKRIAFTSDREGNSDIYIMNADGSGAENVTNTPDLNEGLLSWSPDGQHLLFSVGLGLTAAEFWTMRVDGSDRRRLVPRCEDCFRLDWSPDGKWLAGQLSTAEGRGLYVIDAGSGARREITDAGRAVVYWSPNGEHIAFVRDFGSANAQVFTVRPDGSDLKMVHRAPYIGRISWSPDGSRLALGVLHELDSIAVDGSDLRQIASGEDIWDPQWSPDGQHIAFSSSHEGNPEIYVVGADGRNPRNLSSSPWEDVRPRWSPDGRRLVFRSNRDSPEGIYWMHPDGSRQTRMTTGPVEPRSGGALPYTYPGLIKGCPEGPGQFLGAGCSLPEDAATVLAQLEQEGLRPANPVLSPDGDTLAFWAWGEEVPSLHVVDLSTRIAERLTEATTRGNTAVDLQWSPDGQYVYYMNGGYCIEGCVAGFLYRIRPDGTGEEQLTTLRVSMLLGFVP